MKNRATQSFRSRLFGLILLVCVSFFASTTLAQLKCKLPHCDERHVLSGDGTTHILARDWGAKNPDRPTLLFLHGYPHSQDAWVKQIHSDLRKKFRIITLDLRGMGQSDKPNDPNQYRSHLLAQDVDSVLNEFGVEKVVLVNHSYGAAPTIAYLIINGTSKVAGLISIAPAHAGLSGLNITQEVFDLFVSQFAPSSYSDFVQSNKDFIAMSYAPLGVPKKEGEDLLFQDLLVPPEIRFAILTAPQEAPPEFVETFLSGLVTVQGVRTLFIVGEDDAVVIPCSIEYLHNLVENSNLISYPNQGHLLMLSNSKQLNHDIEHFVDD